MAEIEIILLIIDALILILLFLSEIPVVKRLKKTTNPLYVALIIYLLSNQFYFIYNIIDTLHVGFFGFNLNVIVGQGLTINNIIFLIILTLQGFFMVFLLGKERLFSFPFIASFYVGLFLILVDLRIVLRIYGGIIGLTSGAYLILNGKKNRNGLILSLGLYLIINEVGFQFVHDLRQVIIMLISSVVLLLGMRGYIDKYFLIDEKEEKKIKGTWIARRVEFSND